MMAGWAASVQVDGDVRGRATPRHGLQLLRRQQLVDGVGQRHQRRQGRRAAASTSRWPGKLASAHGGGRRGDPGVQEIAEAQGTEQQDARRT